MAYAAGNAPNKIIYVGNDSLLLVQKGRITEMPSKAPTGADKEEVLGEKKSRDDIVRDRGLFMRFLVGASAAGMACIFSNPGEVQKTRIQLQGELMAKGEGSRAYNSTWDAIVKTIKHDGVRGLQKGLGTGIAYQVSFFGGGGVFSNPFE